MWTPSRHASFQEIVDLNAANVVVTNSGTEKRSQQWQTKIQETLDKAAAGAAMQLVRPLLAHNRSSSDAEGCRVIYVCLVTGAVQELGWCPAVCICQEGAHAPHHWCPRHHSRSGHPWNDGPLAHPAPALCPPWLTRIVHYRATREVLPFDSVMMTG